MVLLFDLSQISSSFIKHKGAEYRADKDKVEFWINKEANTQNSTGLLILWPTVPDATYRLSVSVKLVTGDRAFIFCETGSSSRKNKQQRLVPRDYWAYPNRPLTADIVFKATTETTVLGVLFNKADLEYRTIIERFELSQIRSPQNLKSREPAFEPKADKLASPEAGRPDSIPKAPLPVSDSRILNNFKIRESVPRSYEIPVEPLYKPTIQAEKSPTRLDFFNPERQIKNQVKNEITVRRYAPYGTRVSSTGLGTLADRIFIIKWDNEPDFADVQMKMRDLEYSLVNAISPDPEKYRKLINTYGPSFLQDHPDPEALRQTETYREILKYARRQRLKSIMIICSDTFYFHKDTESILERIPVTGDRNSAGVRDTGAFFLHSDNTELTLLQQNKIGTVPFYRIEAGHAPLKSSALVIKQELYNLVLDTWDRESSLFNFFHVIHNAALQTSGIVVAYPNIIETDFATQNPNDFIGSSFTRQDFLELFKKFEKRSIRQLLYDLPINIDPSIVTDKKVVDFLLGSAGKVNKYHLIALIEGRDPGLAVIIPSYNNKDNYQRNLRSVFAQEYRNYRVIYVDDCSTDKTADLVETLIKSAGESERCQLLIQRTNQKQGASRYIAYHRVDPDEILIFLDGDDWLAHEHVFRTVADAYMQQNIWASYGSFYKHTGDKTHWDHLSGLGTFPGRVIEKKMYRQYKWTSQHLRTGLAGLYQRIKIQDLWDQTGRFLHTCTDLAENHPILEMAGTRHTNLKEGLYVYNQDNSVQYEHSFYNLRKKDNRSAKVYHDSIIKNFKKRKPYNTLPADWRYKHYKDSRRSVNLVVPRDFLKRLESWITGTDLTVKIVPQEIDQKTRTYKSLTETYTIIIGQNETIPPVSTVKLALKWMISTGADVFHFGSEREAGDRVFVVNELTPVNSPNRVQAFSYRQPYKPKLSVSGLYLTSALKEQRFEIGLRQM